jgi:WD40 repeat protein
MRQLRLPRPVITLSLIVALFAGIGVSSAAAQQELSSVYTVAWSPDGTKIALAGLIPECTKDIDEKFSVYILDAITKQVLKQLSGHRCYVISVAWSPDGTQLATSGVDGKANVWDVASGRLVSTTKEFALVRGKIAWSSDGTQIATASPEDHYFEIFNPSNGEEIKIPWATGRLFASTFAWQPNGSLIATDSDDDNQIKLWNPSTGQLIDNLIGHTVRVIDMDWSPDGQLLASSDKDKHLIIWDISTRKSVRTILADEFLVKVKWSPDGHFIAGAPTNINDPQTAYIWDATTGQLVSKIESKVGNVLDLAWSPDGSQLAYVGEKTGVHGENLQIIPAPTSAVPEATSTAEPGGK